MLWSYFGMKIDPIYLVGDSGLDKDRSFLLTATALQLSTIMPHHARLDEEDGVEKDVEMRESTQTDSGNKVEEEPKQKQPEDNSLRGRFLAVKSIITGNKLNVLLICIPFG
jgi:hypothetical protein